MPSLEDLKIVQKEVYDSLVKDYGAEKVKYVDDLGEQKVLAIIKGFDKNIEPWVKEIIVEFEARIINHPLSGIKLN